MKDDMCVLSTDHNIKCLHLKDGLRLACIEDWEGIVLACHARAHLTFKETIEKIKSTWCTNIKRHGIPIRYVKSLVGACGCSTFPTLQDNQCLGLQDRQGLEEGLGLQKWTGLQRGLGLQYKEQKREDSAGAIEQFSVNMAEVDGTLEIIMIKHKVRLVIQSSRKQSSPFSASMFTKYVCHRGGRVGRKGGDHQRLHISKKCGCPFKVEVRYPPLGVGNVTIIVHGQHEGHNPGSRSDLYHLPVHPCVINRCMEDLFDVGTCRHVAKMSLSKEAFHFRRASPIDQVTFQFFMIPKEIQTMSYRLHMKGNVILHFTMFCG